VGRPQQKVKKRKTGRGESLHSTPPRGGGDRRGSLGGKDSLPKEERETSSREVTFDERAEEIRKEGGAQREFQRSGRRGRRHAKKLPIRLAGRRKGRMVEEFERKSNRKNLASGQKGKEVDLRTKFPIDGGFHQGKNR